MQTELADRVLAHLAFAPDVGVCPACTAARLGVEQWDIMKAIRELVASRSILCTHAIGADCGGRVLVARVARKLRREAPGLALGALARDLPQPLVDLRPLSAPPSLSLRSLLASPNARERDSAVLRDAHWCSRSAATFAHGT